MRALASFSLVVTSLVALTACGSSKPAERKDSVVPADMENMPEDDSWTQASFDIPECDGYFAKMATCRGAFPVNARGAMDAGMLQVVVAWREAKAQDPVALVATCQSATEDSAQGLGEVCPGVFPAPKPE